MNMRGAALAAGLAALTGGCALGLIPGLAGPASAGAEHITSYVIGAVIEPGGSVRITETISYDFGADRRHGIFRDLPYLQPVNAGQDREYPISGIRASSPDGSPDQTAVSRDGGVVHIRIGSPDQTITGAHTYVISYEVRRALTRVAGHAGFSWNLVGDDWGVPIRDITARVSAPAGITGAACFAGTAGSRAGCGSTIRSGRTVLFRQAFLAPGEGLTVQAEVPVASVTVQPPLIVTHWSLGAALAPTVPAAALGAAFLIIVAAWLLVPPRWWRWPRPGAPGLVLAGGPDGPACALRPGQAGVVLIGAARPAHVVATLVDLAIRGHLRIADTGEDQEDWLLIRLGPEPSPAGAGQPSVPLLRYERTLLAGIFGRGDETRVSALKGTLPQTMTRVSRQLRRDAVRQGWLPPRRRPTGGWVLAAAGAVLFITGLIPGLPHGIAFFALLVMLGGAGMILAAWRDRDRETWTPEGARRLDEMRKFRKKLRRFRPALDDPWTGFTSNLPYAIAFGLVKGWVERFATVTDPVPESAWWVGAASQPPPRCYWSATSLTNTMCSYAPPDVQHHHPDAASAYAGYGGGYGGMDGGMGGMVGGGGGGGGGGSW
jgi:hypothetical protein